MKRNSLPLSVLNLVPMRKGQHAKEAIEAMVDLAQATENMGYKRYWIAEHHNTPSLMSSATSLLIKHTLEHTNHIRVGAGGIMLPNHSPLVVAEQFGTLATLYPNRVDLGLGRAPGTDIVTANALRRQQHQSAFTFPEDVKQLLHYLGPIEKQGEVKAYPGVNTNVPIYILGSSTESAYLASKLGLPYVFASHFAPTYMEEAITIYRQQFQPSEYLKKPMMIVCVNVIAAESDEEAMHLATTMYQFHLNILRGTHLPLLPPVTDMDRLWSSDEKEIIMSKGKYNFIGSKQTIHQQLTHFQATYHVDELMAVSYIYDVEKQKRSYKIFMEIVEGKLQ